MVTGKKIGVISLGCDKNRVDTEKMLSVLSNNHAIVSNIEDAEIVIINTCAFLESSRKEAIDEILSVSTLKEDGLEKIIVTGCLPQKFISDIVDDLPEVDAFMGVSDYGEINSVIDRIYDGERVIAVGEPRGECGISRVRTTGHYAYLKIADGCSNYCTYCLIPKIRGKFRSVSVGDLIKEAELLGEVKELILVAQDLTKYGVDLVPKTTLAELIRKLSKLSNIQKIRLLYCYPEGITDELIDEIASNDKVIKYVDIPFQHASDRILKLMNRKGTGKGYLELISKLKERVNGIAIRSTFITGFPTETEEDFEFLTNFLEEAELFNAGFFAYSREEGTGAAKMDGQIKRAEKTKRLKKLYSVQKKVVKKTLKKLEGQVVEVMPEGFDEDGFIYYGRAYFNAPDIDGKVYFFSDEEVEYGESVSVKILKADGYDLYGERL